LGKTIALRFEIKRFKKKTSALRFENVKFQTNFAQPWLLGETQRPKTGSKDLSSVISTVQPIFM
jgi:hypothetical protein